MQLRWRPNGAETELRWKQDGLMGLRNGARTRRPSRGPSLHFAPPDPGRFPKHPPLTPLRGAWSLSSAHTQSDIDLNSAAAQEGSATKGKSHLVLPFQIDPLSSPEGEGAGKERKATWLASRTTFLSPCEFCFCCAILIASRTPRQRPAIQGLVALRPN